MQLHVTLFNNIFKYKVIANKHYKKLLTYISNDDVVGICEFIDKITDPSYNVYQKFILLLHIYKNCINNKITFTKDNHKYVFYLDDLIDKMTYIDDKRWVSITDNLQILIQLPTKFFDKLIHKDYTLTTGEMNNYFINNCISSIKFNNTEYPLSADEIDNLPADIFNKIVDYIRNIDVKLQKIQIFGDLNLGLSLFSMLTLIVHIFKHDAIEYLEFEYIMRKHAKLTNFDEITYKQAHDFADIYSHELREQKDALDEAKRSMQ